MEEFQTREVLEEMPRFHSIPDELSGPSDVEEEDDEDGFTVDYEDTFEELLPVRSSPLRYNNFSALKDDWDLFDGNSSGSNKKVRFNNESLQGKRNVEELLQYANQLNTYLALNLGKLDTIGSEWTDNETMALKSNGSETTLGTIATATLFSMESASNFELSDSEAYENILSPEPDQGLKKGIEEMSIPSLEQILEYVRNSNECNNVEKNDKSSSEESSIISKNTDCMAIESVKAVEIFQKTIGCILHLSQMSDHQFQNTPSLNQFYMKGKPTLGYQEFIARIQSKCAYNPSVFLAATFLLQTLYLEKSSANADLHLRNQLQESQIHHLVIACVRIASKMMEDYVHSHQYFCKVCGISKRLLSRLEIFLLASLKDELFMVTKKRLASAPKVIDDLMASRSNES